MKGQVEWRPGSMPDTWRAEVGRVRLFICRQQRGPWWWEASLGGRRIAYGQPGGTLRSCQLAAERWATPTSW